MDIFKVGVVGGGAMGSGLAALIARKGVPVVVKEILPELAEQAQERIYGKFKGWCDRGKISESQLNQFRAMVSVTYRWEDCKDVDLLIEAVSEKMDVKKKVFSDADKFLPPHVVFASNTSALSISEMAESVSDARKPQVVGLHFFNPPTQMPLVELIATAKASKEVLDAVADFAANTLGKTVVRVKECPGFLVNRLLMPYLNEATVLLMETKLTPEQIDAEAKNFGWPMGPFTLLDMLGLDVAAEVADILQRGYGERAKFSPILRKLVDLKRFGVKSGAGFYGDDVPSVIDIILENYPDSRSKDVSAADGFRRMMAGLVNEAVLALEEGVASAEDIELGCLYGIGFPLAREGPLHWAQKNGLLAKPIFGDSGW